MGNGLDKLQCVTFYINGVPTLFKAVPGQWDSILFEVMNGPERLGWFARNTCKAVIYAYYMVDARELYLVNIRKVKDWVSEYAPKELEKNSNGGKYYKIPILALKNSGALIEVVSL
jgi:hypothetical protein